VQLSQTNPKPQTLNPKQAHSKRGPRFGAVVPNMFGSGGGMHHLPLSSFFSEVRAMRVPVIPQDLDVSTPYVDFVKAQVCGAWSTHFLT
jgi:hypothetical protein